MITVEFFGALQAACSPTPLEQTLPLQGQTTVADMLQNLSQLYPNAQTLLMRSACAIDATVVPKTQRLQTGDHLVILPPVGGG